MRVESVLIARRLRVECVPNASLMRPQCVNKAPREFGDWVFLDGGGGIWVRWLGFEHRHGLRRQRMRGFASVHEHGEAGLDDRVGKSFNRCGIIYLFFPKGRGDTAVQRARL